MKKSKPALFSLIFLILGSGIFTVQAQIVDEEATKKLAAFSEDIAAHPNFADSYVYRGNVYLGINKLTEAFADAGKALELEPKNLGALLLRGKIKTRRKDYDEAITDITAVITLNYPGKAQGYYARGEAYEKKGDLQKAYVDYKKALEIYQNSDDYIAAVSRVESLLKNQNINLAAPELNFTSAENRKKADAAYEQADKFIKKLEWQAAVDSYTKAIELDPQFASAFKNRADIYGSSLNQYDRALADYAEAIRLKPDYHDAYAARGGLYYINNKPDLALAEYNEALRIYPDNTEALLGRGRIYSRLRRFDKSIADWEKYLAVYPNAPNAAQVRLYITTDRQAIARSVPVQKTRPRLSPLLEKYASAMRPLDPLNIELDALGKELSQNTAIPARNEEILARVEQSSLKILSVSTDVLKSVELEPESADKNTLKKYLESSIARMKNNLEGVAERRYIELVKEYNVADQQEDTLVVAFEKARTNDERRKLLIDMSRIFEIKKAIAQKVIANYLKYADKGFDWQKDLTIEENNLKYVQQMKLKYKIEF